MLECIYLAALSTLTLRLQSKYECVWHFSDSFSESSSRSFFRNRCFPDCRRYRRTRQSTDALLAAGWPCPNQYGARGRCRSEPVHRECAFESIEDGAADQSDGAGETSLLQPARPAGRQHTRGFERSSGRNPREVCAPYAE